MGRGRARARLRESLSFLASGVGWQKRTLGNTEGEAVGWEFGLGKSGPFSPELGWDTSGWSSRGQRDWPYPGAPSPQ